ncbi:MAG: Na(+)/H(+) antiporter subunit B [Planctomycetes bacterium]|nr:Na(+)/H(+) antiporter subunit B [Planctomycetota bacterium]
MLLRNVCSRVYVLALIVSVWILLRGHNEPGGGFIGGLVAAAASIALAMAFGAELAARRFPFRAPVRCGVLGVLITVASGVPALWRGEAYLTHPWSKLELGVFSLDLSSVLLFDLGVYLCVWGALGGLALELLELDASEDQA